MDLTPRFWRSVLMSQPVLLWLKAKPIPSPPNNSHQDMLSAAQKGAVQIIDHMDFIK